MVPYVLSGLLPCAPQALMVCNLSPATAHLHESLCSLRFAKKINACVTAHTGQQ
jgi:hypothetical protein